MKIKIYPDKPLPPKIRKIDRYHVCACLHGSYVHENKKECTRCQCPKYREVGNLTYNQWEKLCIESGVSIIGR